MSAEHPMGDPAAPTATPHKPAFGSGLLASRPEKDKGAFTTGFVSLVVHVVLLGGLIVSTIGTQTQTQNDEVTVMELTQELAAPPPPPPPPVEAEAPAEVNNLEFTVPDVIPADIPPPGNVEITAASIYDAAVLNAQQDTADEDAEAVVAIGETPSFTPFTVAPVVQNRDEVARALEREYPALLRDAGVGGRAIVWLRLDEQGIVQDVQINTSSGHPALDEAALKVGEVMRFSPAMNRDKVVPVWVSIPVSFQVR